MSNTNARAKIEIRLEFRQLVLLSLGTMAFSGSLFALGYFLGTRDGLRSVKSPAMIAEKKVKVETEVAIKPRQRVVPTRAALGEVEFLFPDDAKTKAKTAETPNTAEPKVATEDRTAIIKARTARRGIPRLNPNLVKEKAQVPVRPSVNEEETVALPQLPEVPNRLRTIGITGHQVTKTDGLIPELTVTGKTRPKLGSKTIAVKPAAKVKRSLVKVSPAQQEVAKPKTANAKPVATKKVSTQKAAVTRTAGTQPTEAKKEAISEAQAPVTLGHLKPTPAHDLSTYGARLFTVQVKAVTDRIAAESVSNALRAKGFEPNVVLADIPDKGRWYRIRVGKFRSRAAADRFKRVLTARGASNERVIVTRY